MTGILSYSILVTASCLLNFCADWFVVGRSEFWRWSWVCS